MGEIENKIYEKIALRLNEAYSAGKTDINTAMIDRLLFAIQFCEIESDDPVCRKFIDDCIMYEDKIMEGFFGGMGHIGELAEVNKGTSNIINHFGNRYCTLENITAKGYTPGLFYFLIVEFGLADSKKRKFVEKTLRKGELNFILTVVSICDNHKGDEGIDEVSRDIIEVIFHIFDNSKYDFAPSLISIKNKLQGLIGELRKNKEKYSVVEDILVTYNGEIVAMYLKKKWPKPIFEKYLQSIEKKYGVFRYFETLKFIEKKGEECSVCREIMEKAAGSIISLEYILSDKKYAKENLKRFTRDKKSLLKEAESHLVNEHNCVSTKMLNDRYNIINGIFMAAVIIGIIIFSASHHYSKAQAKGLGFIVVFPLLLIVHKIYWSVTAKMYGEREAF